MKRATAFVLVTTYPFEEFSVKSCRGAQSYPAEAREFRAFSCFQLCSADSDRPCWLLVRLQASRAERGLSVRLSYSLTVCGISGRCPVGNGWPESQNGGL